MTVSKNVMNPGGQGSTVDPVAVNGSTTDPTAVENGVNQDSKSPQTGQGPTEGLMAVQGSNTDPE